MGSELWVALLAVFSIFFVPITGLMLILTTRFALKPFMESLSKALTESRGGTSPELVNHVRTLTEQVESLAGEVRQLKDAQDFDRKLLDAKSDEVEFIP
jgi:hypothetical protein